MNIELILYNFVTSFFPFLLLALSLGFTIYRNSFPHERISGLVAVAFSYYLASGNITFLVGLLVLYFMTMGVRHV